MQDGDTRVALPPRALGTALLGLVVGNVAALLGYAVGTAAAPHEQAPALLLSEIALWAGMLGACWAASRTYGTGRPRLDFAFRPRPVDVAWGALFSVVDLLVAGAVSRLLSLLDKSLAGSNSNVVTDVRSDLPALAATIAFAVAGAPIVEELFFRGLVQRALQPAVGLAGALAIQALVFGGVHVVETTGAGRLGLWLALSAVGLVHGLVYQRFKRITVSMWTHAFFNVIGVVLIFAG